MNMAHQFEYLPVVQAMDNSELSEAIQGKDIHKVRRLLALGKCWINGDSSERDPPIIECILSGYDTSEKEDAFKCDLLKVLVKHDADVNCRSQGHWFGGRTAAMYASFRGLPSCLQLLHESGADLSIVSPDGETALTLAVTGRRLECVKYLTEHIPCSALNHKNHEGKTALMIAASTRTSYTEDLQHLLAAGADVDVEDKTGKTAVMFAFFRNFTDGVELLLEQWSCTQKEAMVTMQSVSDVDVEDKKCETASHPKCTAPVTSPRNTLAWTGAMPLSYHIYKGQYGNIAELLESGVDPTLFQQDKCCLHLLTVNNGPTNVMQDLIKSGFPLLDLDFKGLFGITYQFPFSPLALAIWHKRRDIAQFLIENAFITRWDILNFWNSNLRLSVSVKAAIGPDNPDSPLAGPLSLFQLCVVALSSALSQDLVWNLSGTSQNESRRICRPTYRERVQCLTIPPALKRAILHQT